MGKLGDILAHPDEWSALVRHARNQHAHLTPDLRFLVTAPTAYALELQARMVVAAKQATKLPDNPQLAFCYDVLNKVSRR